MLVKKIRIKLNWRRINMINLKKCLILFTFIFIFSFFIGSATATTITSTGTIIHVDASISSGAYKSPQKVTITAKDNKDPSPKIYYTTNGSNPTVNSNKYSKPLNINKIGNTTLKYIAIDINKKTSGIQIQHYLIVKPITPNNYIRTTFIRSSDYKSVNKTELLNAGITDVYVAASRYYNPLYSKTIPYVINALKGTNIKVHAWLICFKDSNGKWVDPANKKFQSENFATIKNIINKYNVAGINLDYVRYKGVANLIASKQNPVGSTVITNFVKNVFTIVKTKNPNLILSADIMPEIDSNNNFYGQNVSRMAPYLDIVQPMTYTHVYHHDAEWVGAVTKNFKNISTPIIVIPVLQTYIQTNNKISHPSKGNLENEIYQGILNGAYGYTLFRYNLLHTYPYSNEKNVIARPTANIKTGTYFTNSLKIFLYQANNLKPFSTIYYTLDGSNPTIKSKKFFNPIMILKLGTTNLKFFSVNSSGNKSPIYTNSYTVFRKFFIQSTNPIQNAKKVSLRVPVKLTFNINIKTDHNYSKIYIKNLNTGKIVHITKTIYKNTLTIKQIYSRLKNDVYLVSIPSGAVKDSFGHTLSYSFQYRATS